MNDWTDIDVHGRTSGQVKALCPACSHTRANKRDRCLSVNLNEGVAKCHHCDAVFVRGSRERHTFVSRPRVYVKPSNWTPPTEGPHEKMLAWFQNRGIPAKVVVDNQIRMVKTFMPQTNKEEWTIAFPFYRDLEPVNVKYRTVDKAFKMEKGCEPIFYGLDNIDPSDTADLLIVEGELDLLSYQTCGLRNVISVPNGTGSSLDECLPSAIPFIENALHVLLAGDSDAPGQKLMKDLAHRIGPEKCRNVTYPSDCKDANDVLVKHGRETLLACVRAATPLPIAGTFSITDLYDEVHCLYENGIPRGVDTCWPSVSRLYRPRLGEWTVVTGIPSSGKSAWTNALLVGLAQAHDWKFAVFPAENLPLAQYVSQLTELHTGIPFTDGPTPRQTEEELQNALDFLSEHFWIVYPEEGQRSMDTILDCSRSLILRENIQGICIDPWNELEHQYDAQSRSLTQYTGESLMRLRQFARNHETHMWTVAHPTKLRKDASGQYPVPNLYDVSDSSHWYNKPDNGIVIHRDKSDERKPAEVYVQKIRFRYSGQLGVTQLRYDKVTGRYHEVDGTFAPPPEF